MTYAGQLNNIHVMLYADRPTIDAPFTVVQLTGTPVAPSYMTEDCGRLYFNAANNLLWLKQQ